MTDAQVLLVEQYASWARRAAWRYALRTWIDRDELESAALLGLVKAALTFDPTRGWAFKTIAHPIVHGHMKDAIRNDMVLNGWSRMKRTHHAQRVEWPVTPHGTQWEPSTPAPNYVEQMARRAAIAAIPKARDRYVLRRLLGGETCQQTGREVGVNESRVVALKARAVANAQRAYAGRGFALALLCALMLPVTIDAQTVVTRSSRMFWTQAATTLEQAQSYEYRAYVDTSTLWILQATCTGAMSPFNCTAPIQPLSVGVHSIELTSVDLAESPRAAPFSVVVQAPPTSPSNVGIVGEAPPPDPPDPPDPKAWAPPIGIPMPSWGITQVCPPAPSPWISAVTDRYYVQPSDPGATNTSNPNGYPGHPRLTLPNPVTPVSGPVLVLIVGVYDTYHSNLTLQGTETNFVCVSGTSTSVHPTLTKGVAIINSTYAILEHLTIDNTTLPLATGGGIQVFRVSHHLAVRHSTVIGRESSAVDLTASGNGTGGIGLIGGGGTAGVYDLHDVTLYDNVIGPAGLWTREVNADRHCLASDIRSYNVWIIDNTIFHCEGDGMQIGAGTNGALTAENVVHHYYIGRNTIYETQQGGVWSKQAVDVIISQNTVHDLTRVSPSSTGACAGSQYGPDYIWYLYNLCHTLQTGITIAGNSGGFGSHVYVIGNLIYNIHDTQGSGDPTNAENHNGYAIMLRSGNTIRVINNTIDDYDGGIISTEANGVAHVNNILTNRNTAFNSYDVWTSLDSSARHTYTNNLISTPVRLRTPSATYTTAGSFDSGVTAGRATGSVGTSAPLFTNAGTREYTLQAGSPAVGAGATTDSAYDTFLSRYGLSIQVDRAAVARPISAWDIGAHER